MKKMFLWHDYELGFFVISEDGDQLHWSSYPFGSIGNHDTQTENFQRKFQEFKEEVKKARPDFELLCPEQGDAALIEALQKGAKKRLESHGETEEVSVAMQRRVASPLHNTLQLRENGMGSPFK